MGGGRVGKSATPNGESAVAGSETAVATKKWYDFRKSGTTF